MYPEDFDMARVMARESVALEDQAAFGTAEQSIEPLLGLRRVRRAPNRDRAPLLHGERTGRFDDTPGVLIDEARWLRAKSRRLRDEAEVAHVESADVQQRARKLLDERRDVL